jgi:hypothetical protein
MGYLNPILRIARMRGRNHEAILQKEFHLW